MTLTKPLIFDAHLDLAMNAVMYDRDQLLSVAALRQREVAMKGKSRGSCTVSLPAMRESQVGICLATVLARALPDTLPPTTLTGVSTLQQRLRAPVILREHLDHANQTIASAAAQAQLAYYRLLEEAGEVQLILTASDLRQLHERWTKGDATAPVGIILSMEGADPIVNVAHADWWWEQGLRTLCLAHYGASAYAMGTGGDGPLTAEGRKLVKAMDRLGIVLDLVHTADTALDEALELYSGPVFVSHGNCRSLVEADRQISDAQIVAIAKRGGVLGIVLDAWMLVPNYSIEKGKGSTLPIDVVVDHIDHICQVTGSVDHVGIGSDLDGGFGTEQTPDELDTIGDLHRLLPILSQRGYTDAEVSKIFSGNWMRFFTEALPE